MIDWNCSATHTTSSSMMVAACCQEGPGKNLGTALRELSAWGQWARKELDMAKRGKMMTGNPESNWEGGNPLLTRPKARKTNAPLQPGSRGLGKNKMKVVRSKRGR